MTLSSLSSLPLPHKKHGGDIFGSAQKIRPPLAFDEFFFFVCWNFSFLSMCTSIAASYLELSISISSSSNRVPLDINSSRSFCSRLHLLHYFLPVYYEFLQCLKPLLRENLVRFLLLILLQLDLYHI